ncbi:O-antigen ligase family protein [Candidatus Thioglobus sp.]|uniref:O-antigen ligase family protein n=1 Tax=Candidatus Thioglobus sp. TaxID=2026721 RepID=UPI003D0D1993
MSERLLGRNYSWFIGSLLFIFPVVVNSVKVAGDLVLMILAITGLFISIFYKTSPFLIKELRLFNWLTLGYFAVVCISILFSGKALELAHFISRELYFLFAPFVALAIFKAKINISVVLYGIKVGLIVLAALVYVNVGSFDVRYSGSINANPYGIIAAILTLFSIIRISKENLINKIITLVVFMSGLLVTLSSGTRTAWIVLFIGILLYLWIAYLNKDFKGYLKFFAMFVLIGLLLNSFAKFPNMENRILSVKQQVISWISSKDVTSSVAVRMEMWEASIKQIVQQPFLTGLGYRNGINAVIAKHADAKAQPQIARYNHVHNTYLNHLLAEGVLGLIAILALLFMPLRLFIANIKSLDRQYYASMGVILIVSFAVFGFSNKLFGDVFINAFYVFYLSLLLPLVYKSSPP